MATISVKDYVMLLTSQSILSACASTPVDTSHYYPYNTATPIHRIICADGTELSVQAHGGVHAKFEDAPQDSLHYSKTFGRILSMCETDCEDLYQYGSDTIEDIEAYVESHGGIDIAATTSRAVEKAIERLSKY